MYKDKHQPIIPVLTPYITNNTYINQTKELFPRNENDDTFKLRTRDKYIVTQANTERLRNSTVPYIQRMMNEKEKYTSH